MLNIQAVRNDVGIPAKKSYPKSHPTFLVPSSIRMAKRRRKRFELDYEEESGKRERKKKNGKVSVAPMECVCIYSILPHLNTVWSRQVLTVVELFKPAKRNPSLSLSLFFTIHRSLVDNPAEFMISRVDDRCKNDILASCALERRGTSFAAVNHPSTGKKTCL